MALYTLAQEQISKLKQHMDRLAERNHDPRIQRRKTDSDTDYYRRLFPFFVALKLSYLHDDELFDRLEIVDSHETGTAEELLDAYMIVDLGDELILHLFQFKYTEKFDRGVSTKELRSFVSRMNEVFLHEDLSEPSNIKAFQRVKDSMKDAISTGRRKLRIHCHFVVNGQGVSESDRPKVDDLREHFSADQQRHGFQFDVFGGLDLFHLVEHGRVPIHDEKLEFECPAKEAILDQLIGPNREGMPERVMVGFMNVNQLIRLLSRYSANELFERNVRFFLRTSSVVNRGIIDTVSSNRNRWFGFMNNGIGITADKVDLLGPPNKKKQAVRLRNMQIINGCQTVNSLFQAKHDVATRDQFNANTNVMVRVYEVSPDNKEFMEALILATNSQNAIRAEDLVANDASLVAMQSLLHDYAIGFERKEGEHFAKNGFLALFTKEDAATAFLAVYSDDAPKLWGTLGRAKLFRRESDFRRVFPDDLATDEEQCRGHALKLLAAQQILSDCRERLMAMQAEPGSIEVRKARYYIARLVYRFAEFEIEKQLMSLSGQLPSKRVSESLLRFLADLVSVNFEAACELFQKRLKAFQSQHPISLDAALKNENFAHLLFEKLPRRRANKSTTKKTSTSARSANSAAK